MVGWLRAAGGTGRTASPGHRGGSPEQGRVLAASLADPCKAMEHIPGLSLLPCSEEVLGSFGVAKGVCWCGDAFRPYNPRGPGLPKLFMASQPLLPHSRNLPLSL